MIGILFILVFFGILIAVVSSAKELGTTIGSYLIASFVLRLMLHWVARNVAFFSHGLGGDAMTYEYFAQWISEQWTMHGIKFMTAADNELIGATSLPPNLFGLLIYMNGGQKAPLACTALVALALCVTALNFFKLAVELGARRNVATGMTMVLFTSPALLFYTSDMYKDGLVLMFVLGAVGSAIRVSRKFSLTDVLIGVVCLAALWFVRFYLVFLATLPILIGYMGFGSRGYLRPALSVLALSVVFAFVLQSQQGANIKTTIDGTFTMATDKATLEGNALGGSAVMLDQGIGSLPIRLVYTLFSPFPWMGGTLGLQLGKIDTIMFYYFMVRAVVASRKLVKTDRATLLSLLAFIIPCTIAYAFTMANMGLMLRQRLPIVVMVALVATLSWPTRDDVARAQEAKKRRLAAKGGGAPAERPRPSGRPKPIAALSREQA